MQAVLSYRYARHMVFSVSSLFCGSPAAGSVNALVFSRRAIRYASESQMAKPEKLLIEAGSLYSNGSAAKAVYLREAEREVKPPACTPVAFGFPGRVYQEARSRQ